MAIVVAMTMAMAIVVSWLSYGCGFTKLWIQIGQHGPKMGEPGVIISANCNDKIGQHGFKMDELVVLKSANCKSSSFPTFQSIFPQPPTIFPCLAPLTLSPTSPFQTSHPISSLAVHLSPGACASHPRVRSLPSQLPTRSLPQPPTVPPPLVPPTPESDLFLE